MSKKGIRDRRKVVEAYRRKAAEKAEGSEQEGATTSEKVWFKDETAGLKQEVAKMKWKLELMEREEEERAKRVKMAKQDKIAAVRHRY